MRSPSAIRFLSAGVLSLSLALHANSAFSASTCIDHIEGVQMAADSSGALTLYVYSREIMALAGNGNTYLFYSGNNEVAKVFQAQFLTAKAGGHTICVGYTPGTPAYRWILSSVGVADADGWPWE